MVTSSIRQRSSCFERPRALLLAQRGLGFGSGELAERLGCVHRGLHTREGQRGLQRAGDALVDLTAADPHTPAAAVLHEDARRAVMGRALVAAPVLMWILSLRPQRPAVRSARSARTVRSARRSRSLKQRLTFAARAAGLVRTRPCLRAIRSRLLSNVGLSMKPGW
jgi:hypothetical protein